MTEKYRGLKNGRFGIANQITPSDRHRATSYLLYKQRSQIQYVAVSIIVTESKERYDDDDVDEDDGW